MWLADNRTPFAIDRAFLRDKEGRETLIVVARGTFTVREDGSLRCAEEQRPVCRSAQYSGDPHSGELIEDTDLVLGKSAIDLLVDGHAHAPPGAKVSVVDVTLRAGGRTKHLRVHGDRVWTRAPGSGVVPGVARPFERQPVTWGRAWGGRDPDAAARPAFYARNPIGSGFARDPLALIGTPAPTVEWPAAPAQAGLQAPAPAGFSAIAPHWAPRIAHAGTYDEAWKEQRAPLLPRDFDERFYQVAPEDQQFQSLPPGSWLELFNMTPDRPFRALLPALDVHVRAIFRDGPQERAAALHTVRLEPDARRLHLVWHASFSCHAREHLLERALVEWQGDARGLFQ